MIHDIAKNVLENNLNIYTAAVMDASGIHEARIRPANTCTNSYSVAKAFTMTAVGMLWDAHKLRLADKVLDILDISHVSDERWRCVTVEHLLKHKAGIKRGFLDIDVDDISAYPNDDFLDIVLSEPLQSPPGTRFQYSDAAYYLLSRIVSALSGQRLDDFLRPVLFGTLGYRELAWSTCPHGYCMGATGLYLRTADMVKLGSVYANDGLYNGKQIVSPEWVELVLKRGYEFMRVRDTHVYAKSGMYGQMLCFSPKYHTACAWHGYETKSEVRALVEQFRISCEQSCKK